MYILYILHMDIHNSYKAFTNRTVMECSDCVPEILHTQGHSSSNPLPGHLCCLAQSQHRFTPWLYIYTYIYIYTHIYIYCRASHTGDAIRALYSSVSVGVVHVLCACAQVQSTV